MRKLCTKCGNLKQVRSFNKNALRKGGLQIYCRSCTKMIRDNSQNIRKYHREYMQSYYDQSAKGRYNRIRENARRQKVKFTFSRDGFAIWLSTQPQICHYCKRLLRPQLGMNHPLDESTYDRKKPSEGYSPENVVLCCRRCNMIKGNWFTEEQMLEIASRYLRG